MSASALAGVEVLTMGSIQDKAPCCGRPSRTGKAFTCLPNWVFGETTANEKAVLLTLQFHAPNIHPSLGTLAKESGLSQRTVQRVLVELEGKGWIAKEETTTASGGRGANRYQLLIWQEAETEVEAETDAMAPWSQWPYPPGQADHTPLVTVANKQEQSSNKRNPTALEPPLPPTARGERRPEAVAVHPCRDRDGFLISSPEPHPQAAEPSPEPPAAVQPQPQQQNPPRPLPAPPDPEAIVLVKPKTQKREAGFKPTVEDVPAALLPVQRELLAFWPARNPKGRRTRGAWDRMVSHARKIQDHQQGGTEILRQQLEEGAEARVSGPGWLGLDFGRWLQYGIKAGTPILGSGFNRRPTPEAEAAAAIAYIRDRDAKAAAAVAQPKQAVLVEVMA